MATNMEKAAELLKNEDFVVKVSEAADQNAAIALFKENGVTVTATELANLGTLLAALRDNDGELPNEVAEQVAGGAFDIKNLGSLLGAIGEFMKSLETPINKLIELFGGSDSSSSGSGSSSN